MDLFADKNDWSTSADFVHNCGVVLFLVLRRRVHCKAPFAQITNTWAFKKILEHFVDRNLNPVPDGHEGEANEETKGASYVRDQRDERVDENLFEENRIILEIVLHKLEGRRSEGMYNSLVAVYGHSLIINPSHV